MLVCRKTKKLIVLTLVSWPVSCLADHPLVTDDTGTLGTSQSQLELTADRSRSTSGASFSRSRIIPPRTENTGTVSRSTLTNLILSYGWSDQIDVSLNLPYQRVSSADAGKIEGVGDTGIELKWRFLEREGVSLALKPQILLPTGNEQRELSNGRMSFGAIAVAAYEVDSFLLLANGGYTYNNNVVDARKDLWSISTALVWKIKPAVQLAFDIGTYRNPDRAVNQNPAFAIIGLIYSPLEKLDLDIGLRKGMNNAEPDHAVGAGITIRW